MKNIKGFVKEWKNDIRARVKPGCRIAIFQVGDNEASNRYVRNKIKDCTEVGITAELFKFDENVDSDIFYLKLAEIGDDSNYCGLMVQLPVPPQISLERIKITIPCDKDIDGFTNHYFDPCTPAGIIKYLEYCGFPFNGADALVIGRSDIVGKPMAKWLLDKNCTVTVAHSWTSQAALERQAKNSDLIICAVGKPHFLDCFELRGTWIIDVGINFVDGKMVGDCYNTAMRNVTPVPGGVGLLTRCALLENSVKAQELQRRYNEHSNT